MNSTGIPFHLLLLGPFQREDVTCGFSSERMSRNPVVDSLIETAWASRLEEAQTRGQSLFPGPMCRFRSWDLSDGMLRIEFGLTDYREFVGTNIANPSIQTTYGEDYLANGTGVCSVLQTADDQLIIQRRSQTVFEHPGMFNFCGGSLNPVPEGESFRADPFEVMTTEFEEELGIAASEILQMNCLGMSRDALTLKPDILLLTRVSTSAATILAAVSDEHSELHAIPNDPASLHQWLGEHWDDVAPSGLASMVAHLACMFSAGVASRWERN